MLMIDNAVFPSAEQWHEVIHGTRNPLNSWGHMDTVVWGRDHIEFGQNDKELMLRLVKSGQDHAKFLRMLPVIITINAPLYWWKEMDTYKVGTTCNSCSTMHKIQAKEFMLTDFSIEHISNSEAYDCVVRILDCLNVARDEFLRTKDKSWWWQMIQLLPSSYNQMRTVSLNYAVLRNIYHARKDHKLDEWHTLCNWIKAVPLSELLTVD